MTGDACYDVSQSELTHYRRRSKQRKRAEEGVRKGNELGSQNILILFGSVGILSCLNIIEHRLTCEHRLTYMMRGVAGYLDCPLFLVKFDPHMGLETK